MAASDIIDYATVATTANATDFGDLVAAIEGGGGCGASTRGLFTGHTSSKLINYITIATTGNAADFGDCTQYRKETHGTQSDTRYIFAGYSNGGTFPQIDYGTIATLANAADFGDLSVTRAGVGACSNNTVACFTGGATYPGGSNYAETNIMDKVTIATLGNATDFGDLRAVNKQGCGFQDRDTDRGIHVGGNSDNIDYFAMSSHSGTASGFGDTFYGTDRKQKGSSGD